MASKRPTVAESSSTSAPMGLGARTVIRQRSHDAAPRPRVVVRRRRTAPEASGAPRSLTVAGVKSRCRVRLVPWTPCSLRPAPVRLTIASASGGPVAARSPRRYSDRPDQAGVGRRSVSSSRESDRPSPSSRTCASRWQEAPRRPPETENTASRAIEQSCVFPNRTFG
jgi:hypothetical protein